MAVGRVHGILDIEQPYWERSCPNVRIWREADIGLGTSGSRCFVRRGATSDTKREFAIPIDLNPSFIQLEVEPEAI